MTRMRTDVGGYGIPAIPTQPLNYLPTEATEPNHLCASVKSVGGSSTLEISVNSVGGLAEGGVGMARCHTLLRKLPQIAQIRTD